MVAVPVIATPMVVVARAHTGTIVKAVATRAAMMQQAPVPAVAPALELLANLRDGASQ
jgi:hypothetical protein